MMKRRKRYDPEFKFKVALDIIKCTQKVSSLVVKYNIHPAQAYQWRQVLLNHGHEIFSKPNLNSGRESFVDKKIQKLEHELQWLTYKVLRNDELIPRKARLELFEHQHNSISISRQCELLGVSRSSIYYKLAAESEE